VWVIRVGFCTAALIRTISLKLSRKLECVINQFIDLRLPWVQITLCAGFDTLGYRVQLSVKAKNPGITLFALLRTHLAESTLTAAAE
jgi:hypothetical protein